MPYINQILIKFSGFLRFKAFLKKKHFRPTSDKKPFAMAHSEFHSPAKTCILIQHPLPVPRRPTAMSLLL